MHVWKYKPDLLDPPDHEQEDRAILQYLRHGGILFGGRIGEIEGFVPAVKPYRKLPEPKPIKVILGDEEVYAPAGHEEVYGPFLPEYRYSRCINCNRSVPFDPSKESVCSKECQQALDNYRERILTWMGMK